MLPILRLTLSYIAGILAQAICGVDILSASILAGISFMLAAIIRKPAALHLFMFFFGLFGLSAHLSVISPHDLRILAPSPPVLATLRGKLIEAPSERVSDHAGESRTRFLAKIEATEFVTQSISKPATGKVLVATPGHLDPGFYKGRIVEVTGVLKHPNGPQAPKLFDYRDYLRWHGIFYLLQADSTNDWKLLDAAQLAARPISDRFLKWSQATLSAGLPAEDDSLRLLWAMALGWTTTLNGEIAEPFMRTGTLHIFAISGLHITLISYILVQLFRLLRLPRWVAGLISIPLIWFYTAATGWQPSAIRSTIMSTVVIGGWILQRPGHLLNSLGVSALIILIWEPQQLFQAGFQLSFLVVLSMAMLNPYNEITSDYIWKGDPFLPEELQWQKRWRRRVRLLLGGVGTTVSGWIGSMPLIAHYFALVTPVSLLANLIIVPLSSLALVSCTASLIVGAIWLPAAELFNQASWFLMRSIIFLCDQMQDWPGAYFYVPALNFWQCAALYGCICGIVLVVFHKKRIGYAFAIIPILLLAGMAALQFGKTAITVLPSSGGSVFVDRPGRKNDLLVDFSDERSARYVISPFLHAAGFGSIPTAVSTIGDVRHVSGAPLFLKDFSVKEIFKSSASYRSSAYSEFIDNLNQAGVRAREVSSGDFVKGWRILHPAKNEKLSRGADKCLVLQRRIDGVTILLLSSLGKAGQNVLMEKVSDLRADIVMANITGNADEPLQPEFLRRINPQVIVMATVEHPAAWRGSRALRQRLSSSGIPVFYTSDSGAVTIESSRSRTVVRDMEFRQLELKRRRNGRN